MNLHLISLGCSKNAVDSEVMLYRLRDYALCDDIKIADVIIINTCGFIEAAKTESINVILNAVNNKKEGAILVVTGCLTQRYATELKTEIKGIDIISGVSDFSRIDELIKEFKMKKIGLFVNNWKTSKDAKVFLQGAKDKRIIANSSISTYVKLSEGCNQNCSFCAIPIIKGRLKSRPIKTIISEINALVSQGIKDISFIAQDSSSYLQDIGEEAGLINLIKTIDSDTDLKSARILYLYPSSTTFALLQAIKDSKTMQNYFDMPLQHISPKILKTMRRKMNKSTIMDLLNYMKDDSSGTSFVRSTFIVGHPEESEAEFEELFNFINDFNFDRVNAFAYSREEDTLSASLEQVEDKIIKTRAKKLNTLIDQKYKANLKSLVGQERKILVDGKSDFSEYFYSGRDALWAREIDGEILINEIAYKEDQEIENGFYDAKITEFKAGNLFAKITKAL